jgi:hypothetical protein
VPPEAVADVDAEDRGPRVVPPPCPCVAWHEVAEQPVLGHMYVCPAVVTAAAAVVGLMLLDRS